MSGVLKEASKQFNGQVFRLGGYECAVHLPDSLRGHAMKVAEHLLESLHHYRFQSPNHQQRVSGLTASIGIALYPFHGSDVTGLLSNADIAMYQAKDGGRNRYVLYDQDAQSLRRTRSARNPVHFHSPDRSFSAHIRPRMVLASVISPRRERSSDSARLIRTHSMNSPSSPGWPSCVSCWARYSSTFSLQ